MTNGNPIVSPGLSGYNIFFALFLFPHHALRPVQISFRPANHASHQAACLLFYLWAIHQYISLFSGGLYSCVNKSESFGESMALLYRRAYFSSLAYEQKVRGCCDERYIYPICLYKTVPIILSNGMGILLNILLCIPLAMDESFTNSPFIN